VREPGRKKRANIKVSHQLPITQLQGKYRERGAAMRIDLSPSTSRSCRSNGPAAPAQATQDTMEAIAP